MIIIGCDYDSHAAHFAILEKNSIGTQRYSLKGTGLLGALDELVQCFTQFRREETFVIIEAPVYIQNPLTSFKLAQVQTLLRVACERAKLKYEVLTSTRWKKLALGKARLSKQEVFDAVRERFGDVITDFHFADAAAMALAGRKLQEEG